MLFHCAVTLIVVIVAAGATELTLSLSPPRVEDSFAAYRANLSYLLDDQTGWKLEPRVYAPTLQVNQYGFRGPPIHPTKAAGVYRVIVTGGSGAYDWYSSDEHTWPHYVEQMLRCRTGLAVEVVNTGTPGYSTLQVLRLLRARLLNWKPDLVLHYELYNDSLYFRIGRRARILEGWKRNAWANYVGWFAHPHAGLNAFSVLLPRATDWFRMRLVRAAEARHQRSIREIFTNDRLDSTVDPVGFGFYAENLRGLASFLQEHGNVPFGVIAQASLLKQTNTPDEQRLFHYEHRGLSHARLWEAYQQAWALDARVASEYPNAFFVPAHELVPRAITHFVDEVHTSNRGTLALAQAVADAVAPRIASDARTCVFELGELSHVRRAVPSEPEPPR